MKKYRSFAYRGAAHERNKNTRLSPCIFVTGGIEYEYNCK
jgi:hypothetical protein